jgi:glycosyltransferase involved in cell wall biosynthesis
MRVHYHTDCHTFGGCEQMLVVLLAARDGSGFTYRWSPAYERGARGRLPDHAIDEGRLQLPDAGRLRERFSHVLRSRALTAAKAITYALPIRQVFQIWDVVVMTRHLQQSRVDILHINNGGFPGGASCNAAVVAARLAGVRRVVYVVNNVAEGYRWPPRWYDYPLDRLAARWVTRFVTGSRPAADALRRVLRLPTDRVVTLHNGVAPRRPDETPEETRSRLSLPPDALVVSVVAVLEPRKGHRVLVEAIARLQDLRLVAVVEGEGPELEHLRTLARGLGVGDRVRFIGTESDVFNLLSVSDVVVLPSIGSEDFPNVPLEAMALGKPVIASRLAGVPEQVVDEETGLLVEPGDPEALAAALARLAADPGMREGMGAAGRARFEREFTADAAARRYEALYREITTGGRDVDAPTS